MTAIIIMKELSPKMDYIDNSRLRSMCDPLFQNTRNTYITISTLAITCLLSLVFICDSIIPSGLNLIYHIATSHTFILALKIILIVCAIIIVILMILFMCFMSIIRYIFLCPGIYWILTYLVVPLISCLTPIALLSCPEDSSFLQWLETTEHNMIEELPNPKNNMILSVLNYLRYDWPHVSQSIDKIFYHFIVFKIVVCYSENTCMIFIGAFKMWFPLSRININ